MGVRAAVGAPPGAALAGRGAGEETGGGAATLAVGAARLGELVRGAGAELGGAGFAVGATGRGATIGRAAAPLLGALPGIIGRGGKSSGRPPAGAAGGAAGLAIGLFSTTAVRFASGTAFGIAVGAGVGPFGTRGDDVSSIAAARAAFARCAPIVSASSVVRPAVGADEFEENSSSIDDPADTVITPPQTEHRARTIVDGTFAGSTRKTERHSGQETFTCPPSRSICRDARRTARSCSASHPCADRSRRRSREESSRSSSFQLQVHSLAPRA
jgi:hypothetical protein